ncbi:glutathione peroxidase [Desertihabitans brevis]|uniref:Glutathione peroxidase n=1 Tax=Desertihabitans brevis TaxID=2268447 RepID=A0A367YSQ7_9ACTN|nr:glutathione peroxidase [Desertihabitans brevis]RCK68589.1 glutathione peroxidase [Desertihabitans brevis]
MTTLADFSADSLDGRDTDLADHLGQVVLVVNTASECGLTQQYEGLQQLYETYQDRGFTVLGFPCDQFAHQEPGDAAQIAEFCQRNFGITFPMFAKIEVNGDGAHPLYQWLRGEEGDVPGAAIEWNFTKFLIDRDGRVLERYAPQTEPASLTGDIERALADPA